MHLCGDLFCVALFVPEDYSPLMPARRLLGYKNCLSRRIYLQDVGAGVDPSDAGLQTAEIYMYVLYSTLFSSPTHCGSDADRGRHMTVLKTWPYMRIALGRNRL